MDGPSGPSLLFSRFGRSQPAEVASHESTTKLHQSGEDQSLRKSRLDSPRPTIDGAKEFLFNPISLTRGNPFGVWDVESSPVSRPQEGVQMSPCRVALSRARFALLLLLVAVLLGACGDYREAAPAADNTSVSSCPTPSPEPSQSIGTVTYGSPITPGPAEHETGTLKTPSQSTPRPAAGETGESPKEGGGGIPPEGC